LTETEGSKISLAKSNVIFDLFEAHEKRKKRESRFSESHGSETALLQYSKACHEKIGIEKHLSRFILYFLYVLKTSLNQIKPFFPMGAKNRKAFVRPFALFIARA
jgi:hypothetical protein